MIQAINYEIWARDLRTDHFMMLIYDANLK